MTSLEIISFKHNIETYIESQDAPKELVRMILKDIYDKVSKEAYEEAMKETEEREKTNGKTDQDEV